jgi:biotin synthase
MDASAQRQTWGVFAERALAGRPANAEEISAALDALHAGDGDAMELLFAAHRVRSAVFGRQVSLCAIAAGKLGGCTEDCKWCAQSSRSASKDLQKARLAEPEEILAAAEEAGTCGVSRMGIVNSGRRPSQADIDRVCRAAEAHHRKSENPGMSLCASLGAIDARQARQLVSAGVRRYHHNLETSRGHYGRVVTTHDYQERLDTLAAAREAGMRLCCGGLFGIGESWQDRLELAETIRRDVRPDVVPVNFLVPVPGTPLGQSDPLEPLEALKILAVYRLMLPEIDLKLAGGRETVLRDLQSWIFFAGATSCMIGNYLTTAGRDSETDLRMLRDLNMKIVPELRPADGGSSMPSA